MFPDQKINCNFKTCTEQNPETIQIMENTLRRKVFVIEDNKTEGMLLKLCLGSLKNVTISNFTNGAELLEHLDENPDIVIADLMLPDIPGYELIKSIKEYNRNIEVIVVSAQRDIDTVAKLQELGVFNYIVKSEACIEYLQKTIEKLLLIMEVQEEKKSTQ